jgi:hypothetical protein
VMDKRFIWLEVSKIADFSCRSGRFIIDEVESLGG